MSYTSKKNIGIGAAFVYLETIVVMLLGYIFWILVSRLTSPETVGVTSTVISLSIILSTIATIGVPSGNQRFLGISFSKQDFVQSLNIVQVSFSLVGMGTLAVLLMFLILNHLFDNALKFNFLLDVSCIILVISYTFSQLLRSVIIAHLKTRILPIALLLGSVLKIIISVILILLGFHGLGILAGYISTYIVMDSVLSIYLVKLFRGHKVAFGFQRFLKLIKEILISSMSAWIPLLVTTIGLQLGPIAVYGLQGANQAGIYFMSLTITSGITSVMYALFTISLPVLSGMTDGRKRFTWQVMRLSLIIVLPFSTCLIFYSEDVLNLLGPKYATGTSSLQILLLSMLPTAYYYGINSYVYSLGKYKEVLAIGLCATLPRVILYFLLVPLYSDQGAAISYTLGAFGGLIFSAKIAREAQLMISWRAIALTFFVPLAISLALYSLGLNYVYGILISLVCSYLILFKLKTLTGSDLRDFFSIIPSQVSQPLSNLFHRFRK